MRGAPFKVTKQQIQDFFHGYDIDKEGESVFIESLAGRRTGNALVVFYDEEDA